MRRFTLVLLLLSGPRFIQGEDLQTSDGTVFTNAAIIRYEAEGIIVKHDGGTNRVAWKQLAAPARQRHQAEARKQKEAEIQKLKQDLARAESEAAVLNEGDGQTPSPTRSRAKKSADPPRAPEPAARPVAELPPVKPGEVLDADELLLQFTTDPPGTTRRYRNKSFRVQGVIDRFEPKLFIRKYDVILESPDRFVRVVAGFDYPNDYRAIYTTQRGQTLVGKPTENSELTMMRVGQKIVLEGKCKGARDGEIAFTGCRLISASEP
jgi:hypothetical protein